MVENPIAALSLLGAFAMSAAAQTPQPLPTSQQPAPAAATTPTQSPASPTSAGAVVFKYNLEALDKNRDGVVSRAEAEGIPELRKAFDKLDRNRDGKLDKGELTGI
jgi:hypothetical protein